MAVKLSGNIKIKKAAPAPMPEKRAETAPVPAAPPSEAKPSFYSPPPPAKKGLFRLSDMIGKKPAAADEMPPPAGATVPASAVRDIFRHPEARFPHPVKRLEERKGEPADAAGATSDLANLIAEKQAAPASVPLPPEPGIKEVIIDAEPAKIIKAIPLSVAAEVNNDSCSEENTTVVKPVSPTQRGEPVETSVRLPEAESVSRYEESRVGIYDVARNFGIEVPDNKTVMIEQARDCLVTIFKKILMPSPERYMIWPMIKRIASDIEGIISRDANVLNILHGERANKDKLVWHSLYTAILAMDLAKDEQNLSCSIYDIGGAALLHDSGLLLATKGYEILEAKDSPDLADHVARGIELARKIDAPEIVLTMISQQYGRLDAKGFPQDINHSTFKHCSQIMAISNIFEHAILNISNGKITNETKDAGESGISGIFRNYRHAFDVDLLKKMIALIGFYPTGSMVELNNRSICKVVGQNRDFPLRPVVQVVMDGTGMHPEEEKLIDLKEVKILSILRAITSLEKRPTPA